MKAKYKVIHKAKSKGEAIKVGTLVELDSEKIPAHLVGKLLFIEEVEDKQKAKQ